MALAAVAVAVIAAASFVMVYDSPSDSDAESFAVGDLTYTVTDSTSNYVSVRATDPASYSGDLVIDSSVTYNDAIYTVTSIADEGFEGSSITTVTIPDTVTFINQQAFYGCDSLESVNFGSSPSLRIIGVSAFEFCTSLTSIDIPSTVTSIDEMAFSLCSSLPIEIPSSVTYFGPAALTGCQSIEVDSENADYYSDDACTLLIDSDGTVVSGADAATIEIPTGATSISGRAFQNCTSVTSVVIPDTVTAIDSYAFYSCSLQSVTFGSSLESIGDYAFMMCTSLEYVALPLSDASAGTSIGNCAFYYCPALEYASLPSTIGSIGDTPFLSCSSMSAIYMDEEAYNEHSAELSLGSDVVRYNYTYEVTFDANGGTFSGDETATAYYGIPFTFDTTATLDGYTLDGWYADADSTGTAAVSGEPWTSYRSSDTSAVTLYAVWSTEGTSDEDGSGDSGSGTDDGTDDGSDSGTENSDSGDSASDSGDSNDDGSFLLLAILIAIIISVTVYSCTHGYKKNL